VERPEGAIAARFKPCKNGMPDQRGFKCEHLRQLQEKFNKNSKLNKIYCFVYGYMSGLARREKPNFIKTSFHCRISKWAPDVLGRRKAL
jgi:hypothetical protein